jgi:hypothetical protein
MADTTNLGLPLLAPAQAQKHVTVNEALARLDGLTQLRIASRGVMTPPNAAEDGETYAVPTGAGGDWAGKDGLLAIRSNGGWVYATPEAGWRGWIADEYRAALFDGAGWVTDALAVSRNGAQSRFEVVEFDHVIGTGASSVTSVAIPQYAMVFSVTGRIKTAITGTLTGWDLGVAGSTNRYGSGYGLAAGSWLVGITGQPVTYYADTPLELTAQGGDFAGGEVRLALHYYLPTPPAV